MTDNRALAVAPERQSENLLAQVIAAAKDPNIDAAKMETLARLVNTQQDREREIEFNMAKNAAITEMPVITKDGRIVIRKPGEREREQGRFARFEDIDRVVRPILARHNLAISFDVGSDGGNITVRPILSHANGFTQRGEAMRLPADQSGGKQPVQMVGSSISYGKRYAECAMLNIITEGVDDDGNGGRGTTVSLTFEREQVVREDAQKAAAEGRYSEWFSKQPPKDRSWLVSSGLHAELGGQPQIAAPKKPDPVVIDEAPPPRREPEPEPERQTTSGRKRSPREWVDAYKVNIDKCRDLAALDALEARQMQNLAGLKAHDPALWSEADAYALKRREDIENGRLV